MERVSAGGLGHTEQLQRQVSKGVRVRAAGGGSKTALSRGSTLSLREVSGVLDYEPAEYTFTALAGTPVAEVEKLLAANGQYLPCDPPLAAAGATLGGTVAAGMSGPGRYRFGGVRDFLLGVRFIDGRGELMSGGARVVKSAAGFDLPKLMVGSLGRFGLLVELTFKVFPRPQAFASLKLRLPDTETSLAVMGRLSSGRFELACLDFEPASSSLWLRLGGLAEVLPRRLERLQQFVDTEGEVLERDADERLWRDAREFAWLPPRHDLIKLPLSPAKIPQLERALLALEVAVPRRYSVGGHLAWLAWPTTLQAARLERLALELGLPALAITGSWDHPLVGRQPGGTFLERLTSVLDPAEKFRLEPAP